MAEVENLQLEPKGELRVNGTVDSEFVTNTSAVEELSPSLKDVYSGNTYAAKKTVAQGMMDIALLTANANQLRYLIEYNSKSPLFAVNVVLIIISLIIQIAVGVSLIFKGRYDMSPEDKRKQSNRLNNYVVVGVFIVTVINVFVAAFSIPASHETLQELTVNAQQAVYARPPIPTSSNTVE
ncbi:hypothetical protein B566_EDAN003700 [Ephemera danica]|nr:hypothetical protein B566_EDAN003700 [Ephemera danica]